MAPVKRAVRIPGYKMFYFSILIFLLSVGWLISSPDWEPLIIATTSLSGILFYKHKDPENKSWLQRKLKNLCSKNITINDENKLEISEIEFNKVFSELLLGKKSNFIFSYSLSKKYRTHAKKEASLEISHGFLRRAEGFDKKVKLLDACFHRLIWLYQKKLTQAPISRAYSLTQRIVNLIFDDPIVPNNFTKLDIYTNYKEMGQIGYPIYIPTDKYKEIENKINQEFPSSGSGLLTTPYNFHVIEIPEEIKLYEVIPAHVYFSEVRYSKIKDSEEYWHYWSWSFGLG